MMQTREQRAAYRAKNREKLAAKQREYMLQERAKELRRLWEITNKDKLNAKQKLYRDRNRAAINERRAFLYHQNIELSRAKARQYRRAHRETENARMKDKRAANPEKYREYNRRATRKYRERYPDTVAQNNISRRNYNKRITTDKWDDILNKLTKKGKTK